LEVVADKGAAARILEPPLVAEVVAEELARLDVDRVFGVPGGEVVVLMDALRRHQIEYVVCHHEANAGIMAAVYGKIRGTIGVALATLGPGAANLMFPIANSVLDREPLLAISAQTPSTWHAMQTHQKLPLLESYGPVSKFAAEITPATCRSVVQEAAAAVLSEPVGPSFLTLTAQNASARTDGENELGAPVGGDGADSQPRTAPTEQAVAMLRDRLEAAERPLVVVGLAVDWAASPSLRRWVAEWELPVAVTPKAKGMIDETSANFVGVVGGMAIDSKVCEALEEADLIVGVGLDPVEIDGEWHLHLPMLWLLESAWATGAEPEEDVIWADVDAVFKAVGTPPRTWDDGFADLREFRSDLYRAQSEISPLTPVGLVHALANAMPADTIVTTDVGSHKYVFGQFWPSTEPGTFFMSNGLSGMGYGLPAAIAAKLARPDRPVLAVLGDGGFAMNSHELETACRLGAPVIVVVLTDGSFSLIRAGQERRGLKRYGVDFDKIDAALVARACGAIGVRTESRREVDAAIQAALASEQVTVLEVPIDGDDYGGIV
jgi:acetolactate synthase I/II/III large subunit